MISHQFHQARLEIDQWLRLSAAVLAHTSHNASLVTAPKSSLAEFRHLELVSIRENIVLLVLVLHGGTVKQQILTLDTPVGQEELAPLARQLGDLWAGLNAYDISLTARTFTNEVAIKVSKVVVDTMRRVEARRSSDIYRDGLLNILNHPEFKDRDGIQQIIRILEERQLVDQLVGEALQHAGMSGSPSQRRRSVRPPPARGAAAAGPPPGDLRAPGLRSGVAEDPARLPEGASGVRVLRRSAGDAGRPRSRP